MSHLTAPPAENGETFHEIPRAVSSDQATGDALARVENAPDAPRVLANSAATFGVSDAMVHHEASTNANGALNNTADFFTASPGGASARGVSSGETAAPQVLATDDATLKNGANARAEADESVGATVAVSRVLVIEGATLNGDAALSRNAPLDFSIVETAPRVLARDDSTLGNAADFRAGNDGVSAAPVAPNNATLGVSPAEKLRAAAHDFSAAAPRVLASSANDDATLAPRVKANEVRENDEPSLLENGSQIGPYEVQAHLGDGGMASVYRVWHTGLHRVEALKVPRQQGRFGPEAAFLRRLLAEARTVANLQHPNIAAIYAISDAASPLQFFSMEFVEGGDLATFLAERKSLAPSVALPILEQVAEALDYAHSQNVIHRDIKPANVLLQSGGDNTVAKVVDFGISRAGEEAGATRLTRSGMIVGTPEYMSPEQSGSGDDVTARTDQYSLGVLAYEMLCGAPPFVAGEGVSRLSLLMKHVGEAPQTPAHRVSGLPVAASDAIIKALSKKPEKRFESCREFVAALRGGLAGHDGIAPAPLTISGAAVRHTRAFSPNERTLQIAPPEAVRRARYTALLAGVGGLAAGVVLVFGWLGYGNFPVNPMSLPAPANIATSTAKRPREYSQVPPRVVMQRETVKFQKVTRETAALKKGVRRLVQKGRAGTREVRLEISVKNGVQDVQRGAAKTLVAPRPQIVEIGAQEKSATEKIAPPKTASAKIASSKVALPPATPTQIASTRATQSAAAPTAKQVVKAPLKRAVKSSGERPAATRRAVQSPKKRRATQRQSEPPRRKARASTAAPRRQSVRRRASTRVVRHSAPRRTTRAFGGAEAGLPP